MSTAGDKRSGLTRAILLAIAAIGAFLIVLPLATSLPGKSDATGQMMSAFRPQMTDSALAQGRADQKTMQTMGDQLGGQMLPALATQLKMTPDQLSAFLAQNFPATAKGLAAMPAMLPFFGNLQATMEAQQANFQQADQIPTSFLPPTSMTMLFVIPGALLVMVAGYGFFRPHRSRRVFAATAIVGLLTVVGLLAESMSSKASAADEMTSAFRPVFAAQNVQLAHDYTATATAMSDEFGSKVLPGLATALHMTPTQLGAMMSQNFSAVSTGAAQLPGIISRMQTATSLIESNVGNYEQSASIPWSPGSMMTMFWFMMASALAAAVVGVGAFALVVGRPTVPRPVSHLRGALHH
jgi:hypothetical protein